LKNGNVPNQEQRAAYAWDILTDIARRRETIRYRELSDAIGMSHHRPLRYVLGYIQNYCLEDNLPPLTILIVNGNGRPGSGFIAWDVDHIEEGLDEVYEFIWESVPNPFEYAKSGFTEEKIVK